jgi:hypothetical protein
MGEEMDGAMQQAPQPGRQGNAGVSRLLFIEDSITPNHRDGSDLLDESRIPM